MQPDTIKRMKIFLDACLTKVDKCLSAKHGWMWFALVGALPLLILIVLVVLFAVNVPFWDQWELPVILQKYNEGTLGFSDFVAQHNEHRLLFPRLIMVGLAVVSGWNVNLEVVTSVVLAAVGMFFLYKILARSISKLSIRLVALGLLSLVFFSPLQQENWLWGWQIQWYLCILGLIVAVWALYAWQSQPWKRVIVAALAAVVATYSLASGMFVWLVCLPLLWFVPELRRWVLPWLAMMAVGVGLHYVGYVDPAYHPSKTLFLDQPVQFVKYVTVYLVHPVIVDFLWSFKMAVLYFGAILAGLMYIYKYHRRELVTNLLPWLCLGLYGVMAAASTGISRLGFGLEQAYSSRYTTLSQFLLLAFIVLLCKIVELEIKSKKGVGKLARNGAVVAIIFFGLFIGLNYAKGIEQMRQKSAHLQKVQHCAQTVIDPNDDCLLKLYPNKEVVWERLQYLRSIHWGGQ